MDFGRTSVIYHGCLGWVRHSFVGGSWRLSASKTHISRDMNMRASAHRPRWHTFVDARKRRDGKTYGLHEFLLWSEKVYSSSESCKVLTS